MDLPWHALPAAPSRWLGLDHLRALRRDYLGHLRTRMRLGDAVRQRVLHERLLDVFDPELLRRLMVEHADALVRWERGPEVFAQTLGQSVLVTEGATWQRQRRMLLPAFAPRRLAGYAAIMDTAAERALAPLVPGPTAMDALFSQVAMDVILHVLFGVPAGPDAPAVAAATQTLSAIGFREMFWPFTLPDGLPLPGKAAKRAALRVLFACIRRGLDAPPRAGADDLLTQLRALRDEDSGAALSDAELADQCMVTFQAGHETTATALLWWSHLMAEHPAAQARAAEEVQAVLGSRALGPEDLAALPWLGATLKEAMRLYPPAAALMTRRLTRDLVVDWGGRRLALPRGCLLRITPALLHRDPRWWPEPEAFRPERFLPGAPELPRGAYLPFGQGPRVCLGQHFALLEMHSVAARLLRRFVLAPSGDPPPRPQLAVTYRPAGGLRLTLLPR